MKKSKQLSKATQEWIDSNVRALDSNNDRFEGGFEQTREGLRTVASSKAPPCKTIFIRGNTRNFLDSEEELVKFASHRGIFQVQSRHLVDLEGIPDEVSTDDDGTSEFTVTGCHSLKEFKETYLPKGAEVINITDCKNLEKIHIRGEANGVNLINLPKLTKLIIDPQLNWTDEMHIFIEDCSSLTIEGIEAKNCFLNITDCESIGFDVEEEEAEDFLRTFKNKTKLAAKKLGLM